jgi:twitching motility two-component system response regulator PilH
MGLFGFFRSIVGRNNSGSAAEVSGQPSTFVERRRRPRVNARDGTRVLIIDDSPTIAIALRKMLGSVGFVPLHAPDAEQGVAMAQKELPDLIFLDIVLPGMNGFAALRALRRDTQQRQIPVIMMSGNEKASEQFFGTRIGADDFMKKPFSRLEVFSRIEQLLDDDLVPRRRVTKAAGSTT